MRVRQTMGGYPVLDLTVTEVQVNPSLAMAIPDAARNVAERVTSEKVAEGVWFIAGGSHNSALIELPDRLILVETPLNDARTQAVIEHVKGLVPGKPIRIVVNSHQQFDHAGGLRAAVAEGATIVTRPTTCPSSSALSPRTAASVRRHGRRRRAPVLPGCARQARDRRLDPVGPGASDRRRPAQRQLPHDLSA
jgi:glyoxylase-like metal-dependent hydrolase (beta-lactamase superfamily II)